MKILFKNKKINLNYFILERYEAGIVLKGFEVKSLLIANANIDQSFIIFKHNEAYILNMYISPYKQAGVFQLDPSRDRKLLIHKNEIIKLQQRVKKERITIIPSMIYINKDLIKVEICLCKSKHHEDKRQNLKKRDAERELKRING